MKLTLAELNKRVHDDNDAYLLLEELRWHGTPVCPHCGNEKAYFLQPKSANGMRGTGHKDANGKQSQSLRRVWKCAKCRKQFSVLTNTIFHGTHVPIQTWLTVMVQVCAAKNGISAREIERMHAVTPETAWFMIHRLREAMRRDPLVGMLSGTIAADETFIGGSEKNKHNSSRRMPFAAEPARVTPGNVPSSRRGRGPGTGKSTVLTLVDRKTGEARSKVIPDVTGATLRKAIAEQVDLAATELHTDSLNSYVTLAPELAAHHTVNHNQDEYVRYEGDRMVTTNAVEGFFSQLKRSLDGTHHHVSKQHLQRYLDEFDFRFSTRKLSDSTRMQQMIDQADGRRLTYKPLTERG